MYHAALSYRCFTFGIGSGASSALVEGLAQAGNGTAEFVKGGERMQPKVSSIHSYSTARAARYEFTLRDLIRTAGVNIHKLPFELCVYSQAII